MLDYDDYALAEHDRAECEAADREAAMDALTDRVQREIERDVMAVLSDGDIDGQLVIAGQVNAVSLKSQELKQDAVDMFMEACMNNTRNLKLLSELIASPAGLRLRQELSKTHAAINATAVAEARGLS